MLVNGKWAEAWHPVQRSDSDGRFVRQHSDFRDRIGPASERGFTAKAGRYQLYVGLMESFA